MSFGRRIAAIVAEGLCLGLFAASLALPQAAAAQDLARPSEVNGPAPSHQGAPTGPALGAYAPEEQAQKHASFLGEPASYDARRVADWVVASSDNRSLPFVIIDKVNAKVFVFGGHGQLRGASAALLGLARGDDSVPGVGNQTLSSIRPSERTTPAGRFVAALGRDFDGQDILWVDYTDAISLHRVITSNPKERRLQRLATVTPLDNRISYGCINVPAKFYDSVVTPAFTGTDGIVYILPEIKSVDEVFFARGAAVESRQTSTQ